MPDQAEVEITMPRLSDSMEEARIVRWLLAPGETVAVGAELVEVETDKATVVYEAERAGTLSALLVAEGEVARLGASIARMRIEGSAPVAVVPAPTLVASATDVPAARQRPVVGRTRVQATPVARRTALELGIELQGLRGTGPGGRIVRSDVLGAAALSAAPEPVAEGGRRVPLSTVQQRIAQRMELSRSTIPSFTVTAELDLTAAMEYRRAVNELLVRERITVNDLLLRATALALVEFPNVNATYAGDALILCDEVNLGVAVALDDALLVPTIRNADRLGLVELARAGRDAVARAHARSLDPSEMGRATFTISNLGMLGVRSFDAVINPPQVAILAVGEVVRRPVFGDGDAIESRNLMQVSLSCDHRVVYGAEAARFLARVRALLMQPLALNLPADALAPAVAS